MGQICVEREPTSVEGLYLLLRKRQSAVRIRRTFLATFRFIPASYQKAYIEQTSDEPFDPPEKTFQTL
jgi:hypothetical protein